MTQTPQAKVCMTISWEVLNFGNCFLDIPPAVGQVFDIRQWPDKFWCLKFGI